MDLVLAMDLKGGVVVHGKKGDRERYSPLTWGISPVSDPEGYLRAMQPRFLYIADIDRISGTGSHDSLIVSCSRLVIVFGAVALAVDALLAFTVVDIVRRALRRD